MRIVLSSTEPWWLKNCTLFGFEGEGDQSGEGGEGGNSSGEAGGEGGNNKSGSGSGSEGDEGKDPEDLSGLKSALAKERAAAKEGKAAKKALADAEAKLKEYADKELSVSEKATKDAQAAQEKVTKLASRLRTNAIDSAIIKLGSSLEFDGKKFADLDDPLKLIDRASLGVEQDENDPADIEVDEKSIKKALTELAASKKHLLVGSGDGTASGGKFGGGSSKGDPGKLSEEALKAKYSGLR